MDQTWISNNSRCSEGRYKDGSGTWKRASDLSDEEKRLVYMEGYDTAAAILCEVFGGECGNYMDHEQCALVEAAD
jgi:hypothetical protein